MVSPTARSNAHPFLRALLPEHRSVVLQGAQEKDFAAGEVIFGEGQPANRFYLIEEGGVALETYVPGKGEVTVISLRAGQVLGWSWLVAPFVWRFQARAVEPVKATVLNGGHLLVACEQNHLLGYELMKNISKVILEVVRAAHERWLSTGHRPNIGREAQPAVAAVARTMPLETRMAEYPFFHGMNPAYLEMLAALAAPREFEASQLVFATGEAAEGLYVVETGRLAVEAPHPDGAIPVQVVGVGEALGWSSFCEPYEWQFDGRAIEPASTLYFKAADMRERCAGDYHFGYDLTKRITRMMLQRLQGTRSHIWEACR